LAPLGLAIPILLTAQPIAISNMHIKLLHRRLLNIADANIFSIFDHESAQSIPAHDLLEKSDSSKSTE
jgi:hypothetical protein